MTDLLAKMVVAAIATAMVVTLAMLGSRATPDVRGYRQLKPGPMHWTGVVLCSGLFVLMAYVWLFVGSKRADGEAQMRILFWLIVAFGLASVYCARSMYGITRSAVRWRGRIIAFTAQGGEARFDFGAVKVVRSTPFGMSIDFDGGASVRIDPYALGASELLDKIDQELQSRRSCVD